MSEDSILVERRGAALHVTMNRPAVRNAFDGAMIEALTAAIEAAAVDDAARVIVLRGAGKGFCAGADLRWMGEMARAADNSEGARRMAGVFEALNRSPKPVIARVHGAVRGGGTGLVAACDIVVATERASFALTEVRLGLAPAVISPYVIGKIGVPAARELFITGDRFDAARARELGLVSRVVADDAELDRVIAGFVDSIGRGGPLAVAACKALTLDVPRLVMASPDEVLPYTASVIACLRASSEGQEGIASFVQKRPAAWVVAADAAAALASAASDGGDGDDGGGSGGRGSGRGPK